jgi:hypothetical protein
LRRLNRIAGGASSCCTVDMAEDLHKSRLRGVHRLDVDTRRN